MHIPLLTWPSVVSISRARVLARKFIQGCRRQMQKMRSNTFSVPRAPGQSPAVPNQHAASVPVQQHTVHGSNESMLEMVKSLRKETKEIHSKLNLFEEQNKTILQELRHSIFCKGELF